MTRKKHRPKAGGEAPTRAVLPVDAPVERTATRATETPTARPAFAARVLVPLALAGITLAAYFNSFSGVFIFDDMRAIQGNPAIRHLWPLWDAMTSPANSGVTSRPIVTLTLAVSYAIDGMNVDGFHLVNLAIHILAGLTLYGVVYKMLNSDKLRARYGAEAHWLAAAAAGIWLVHPLQTESVTYIIQRAESLMGLFFLLTIYCSVRGFASRRPFVWFTAAVVACAFGMGCKEVMVTAPVLVLLYDRIFVTATFGQIVRRRWAFYASLFGTWLVLVALLATLRAENQTVLVNDLTPLRYALTQFEVIVYYLRLSFWPHPLVLDYLWPLADALPNVLPWAVVVVALLAVTIWALFREKWAGFWGAWFFIVLAPTSTVVPIADAAFEHRMYLPLAAVSVLTVVGTHALLRVLGRRIGLSVQLQSAIEIGLVLAAIATLGYMTALRNDDYRSEESIYSDTVSKRPANPRARTNLGVVLNRLNKPGEAEAHFSEAVRLKPDFAEAQNNLAAALLRRGQSKEAAIHASAAVRLKPDWPEAHHNLGLALLDQGDAQAAVDQFSRAIQLKPDYADAHGQLGAALARLGRAPEAMTHLAQSSQLSPGSARAHNELGNALYGQGRSKEAGAEYAQAVRLDPGFAEAHQNFGLALLEQGDVEAAMGQFAEAIRLKPDYAKARNNLGILLYQKGRIAEAIEQFSAAARADPSFAEARRNLQAAQAGATQGRNKP